MTDPRYIPPSDREPVCDCGAVKFTEHSSDCTIFESPDHQDLLDHAAFMDERDARQRDLIRRLAEALDDAGAYRPEICSGSDCDVCSGSCRAQNDFDRYARLVAEARGVEATNE